MARLLVQYDCGYAHLSSQVIAHLPSHVGVNRGRRAFNRATGALLSHAQVSPNSQPCCNRSQTCHQVNRGRDSVLGPVFGNGIGLLRAGLGPQLVHKFFWDQTFAGPETVDGDAIREVTRVCFGGRQDGLTAVGRKKSAGGNYQGPCRACGGEWKRRGTSCLKSDRAVAVTAEIPECGRSESPAPDDLAAPCARWDLAQRTHNARPH
jgi:hypothetical protein